MTDLAENDANRSESIRGYGTAARLFHWIIALMVIVQIPAGIAMTSEPLAALADPLFALHKGMGAILLVLVAARILWRVTHRPPALPAFVPALERRIANATHVALYTLLVAMVVSGYVRTVGDRYPIELLDMLGIPPFLPEMPAVAGAMLVVHRFAAIALVAFVAVHVSAALRHRLIERDGILSRMWPPLASGSRGRSA